MEQRQEETQDKELAWSTAVNAAVAKTKKQLKSRRTDFEEQKQELLSSI